LTGAGHYCKLVLDQGIAFAQFNDGDFLKTHPWIPLNWSELATQIKSGIDRAKSAAQGGSEDNPFSISIDST
jgi:hypothetical protein